MDVTDHTAAATDVSDEEKQTSFELLPNHCRWLWIVLRRRSGPWCCLPDISYVDSFGGRSPTVNLSHPPFMLWSWKPKRTVERLVCSIRAAFIRGFTEEKVESIGFVVLIRCQFIQGKRRRLSKSLLVSEGFSFATTFPIHCRNDARLRPREHVRRGNHKG